MIHFIPGKVYLYTHKTNHKLTLKLSKIEKKKKMTTESKTLKIVVGLFVLLIVLFLYKKKRCLSKKKKKGIHYLKQTAYKFYKAVYDDETENAFVLHFS